MPGMQQCWFMVFSYTERRRDNSGEIISFYDTSNSIFIASTVASQSFHRSVILFDNLKNTIMQHYVLGFAFNQDKDYVVLIHKNKPDWQKGCLNGVGGKIEDGETPIAAMVREFEEETGLPTNPSEWDTVGTMGDCKDWICHVFVSSNNKFMYAETKTDEEIMIVPIVDIITGRYEMISNIPFLIELCRDSGRPHFVSVSYAQ